MIISETRRGLSQSRLENTVSGEGVVTAVPDMASVSVGVTTQAKDAAEAMAANNRAMASLVATLDTFSIAPTDRQSSGFNVYPRYDRPADGRNSTEITSYVVSNQLTIRVRNIDRLGELLSAGLGVNGMSWVTSPAVSILWSTTCSIFLATTTFVVLPLIS